MLNSLLVRLPYVVAKPPPRTLPEITSLDLSISRGADSRRGTSAVYGNQIFRNVFLQIVTGRNSSEVIILWLYNLVNVGCELVGYYLAALLIDHKRYGRTRMQAMGLLMNFVLFVIAAASFPNLDTMGAGAHGFEFIYFFLSFWIHLGPNSTTFLVAVEVYPAPVRGTAHGLSAAVGMCGALMAIVLYLAPAPYSKLSVVWTHRFLFDRNVRSRYYRSQPA